MTQVQETQTQDQTQTEDKVMQAYLGHVRPHHGGFGMYDVIGHMSLDGITGRTWDDIIYYFSGWVHDNDMRWRFAPEISGLVYGQRGKTVYIYPPDDDQAGSYYDLYVDEVEEEDDED